MGAALTELHTRPSHAWTLESLARAAGTSRSVLAERFQHLIGSAPMEYLTQWRMVAANLLCGSNAPLARIAEDVGYQTDTAFIRAFRREYGMPPATQAVERAVTRCARSSAPAGPEGHGCVNGSSGLSRLSSRSRLMRS